MRKLSVPYTIRRNGIFYLNLRWNNQIIRQSLATKDPMEAFQKVNQIAPIFAKLHSCVVVLRQQISDILGQSRRSEANGLKLGQSDEAMMLLSQGFYLYQHEQMIENWGTRTATQMKRPFNSF